MRSLCLPACCAALLLWRPAAAQTAPARRVENRLLGQAHGLIGRNPATSPGPERYFMAGATLAYRNRRREPDAAYDTDLTFGARYGVGRARRSGYVPNNRTVDLALRGANLFAAADGRFVGAALGVWLGKLGTFRGDGQVRGLPQLRVRAGRLDGWHAQLDYADDFLGLANPPARLGGGLRLPGTGLTLAVGAAIPTQTVEGREVQAFGKALLRLGPDFEAGLYAQPALGTAAPAQFSFSLGYLP